MAKFFLNRNFILLFAVIMGIFFGDYAILFSSYSIYILAITMVFSSTGIETNALWPLRKLVKPMLLGTTFNYIIFGTVVLILAWLLVPDNEIFLGFVVIVAAPPGVAIIPFTVILKGDIEYAIIAVFGAFIASIGIAPILIGFFSQGTPVNPWELFILMIELVLIPLLLSRFLLLKKLFPYVEKIRGKAVDWGFALIIFTAVGMNRSVFFSNPSVLFICLLILLISTIGLGSVYEFFSRKSGLKEHRIVPNVLVLTIKSSGFSVVTAFKLFGQRAAIPSAILAVVVLFYLLFLSFRKDIAKRD